MFSPQKSSLQPYQQILNLIGTTDLKGGDTVNVEVEIDVKDVAANTIQIKVLNSGISDGSQTSFLVIVLFR